MYQVPAEFVGVSTVTLQSWLTAAQQALQDLTTGGKVVVAAYAQGDGGNKSVTYTRADMAALRQRIAALVQVINGGCPRRRPARPLYL